MKTYELFEDNASGIYLFELDDAGACTYAHQYANAEHVANGLEQLREDLHALQYSDCGEWDSNDLDKHPHLYREIGECPQCKNITAEWLHASKFVVEWWHDDKTGTACGTETRLFDSLDDAREAYDAIDIAGTWEREYVSSHYSDTARSRVESKMLAIVDYSAITGPDLEYPDEIDYEQYGYNDHAS